MEADGLRSYPNGPCGKALSGMLPNAGDDQPADAVGEQQTREQRGDDNEAARVKGAFGQVWLDHRDNEQLLPLRLFARLLECGGGEFVAFGLELLPQPQSLVIARAGGDAGAATGEPRLDRADFTGERGDAAAKGDELRLPASSAPAMAASCRAGRRVRLSAPRRVPFPPGR